jgi:hypothetical protein
MASLSRGFSFGATEQVTNAKLHTLVDSGAVTDIVTADIQDSQITDAKISAVSGSKFVTLANTPSGAGKFPIANLPFSADGDLGTSDTLVPTQKAVKTYADAIDTSHIAIPASGERGDILYHNGTVYTRLAKGTNGQYLTIGANDPAWLTFPSITESHLGTSAVSQAKLKTATGSTNGNLAQNAYIAIAMNAYCFSPNIYTDGGLFHVSGHSSSTGDQTARCGLLNGEGGTKAYYVRWRYVNSSDPEPWVFVLVNKETNKIECVWESEDHVTEDDKFICPIEAREGYDIYLIENQKWDKPKKMSLSQHISENYILDGECEYKPRILVDIDEDEKTLKTSTLTQLPTGIKYGRLTKGELK